jgi:hypothetical protein
MKKIRTTERVISTISLYFNYLSVSFSEVARRSLNSSMKDARRITVVYDGAVHLKRVHLVAQTLICRIGVPTCVLSPEDWSKTTIVT